MKSAMSYKLLMLLIVMMLGAKWLMATPAQSSNSKNYSDVERAVSPPLAAQSNNSSENPSDVGGAFGAPLMFIENVGQFADDTRFQSTFVGHRNSDMDEALVLSGVVISETWSFISTAGVLDTRKEHDAESTVPPSDAFVENGPTSAPEGSKTITHSTSQTITRSNSPICGNQDPLFSRESSYYRVFDLANDFGINRQFNITSVRFGVDLALGAGGDQPITVNLYTLSGSFELANLTLISTFNAPLPNSQLSIIGAPIQASVPAGATLVVKVLAPDGENEGNFFVIGSNAEGQTGPSYIRAPSCGNSEPTDMAQIGFENTHLVINVDGQIGVEPNFQLFLPLVQR